MKRKGMSKTNLFFLECMVSIVIFALASLVILQAFMKVEEVRIRSQEEMQALVMMCTITEYIQAEVLEIPEYASWYCNAEGDLLQEGETPHFQVELNEKEALYEGGVLQNYEIEVYRLSQSQKQSVGNLSFATYNAKEVQLEERSEGIEN